jgi:cell wall-associated NlpC family hydrolase
MQVDAVKIEVPIPGCVAVIKLHGFETHVAVYIGNGEMIHCTHDCGVRIDSVRSYKAFIEGFYTW